MPNGSRCQLYGEPNCFAQLSLDSHVLAARPQRTPHQDPAHRCMLNKKSQTMRICYRPMLILCFRPSITRVRANYVNLMMRQTWKARNFLTWNKLSSFVARTWYLAVGIQWTTEPDVVLACAERCANTRNFSRGCCLRQYLHRVGKCVLSTSSIWQTWARKQSPHDSNDVDYDSIFTEVINT